FDVTPAGDGTVTVKVNMAVAHDAAGNNNTGATFNLTSDRTNPTGTIAPTGVGMITGTASDATTGVASVVISIFNGTMYWDGTGFNSATEVFLTTTTSDNFANWSFAFTQMRTFTVHAKITDGAGNVGNVTGNMKIRTLVSHPLDKLTNKRKTESTPHPQRQLFAEECGQPLPAFLNQAQRHTDLNRFFDRKRLPQKTIQQILNSHQRIKSTLNN